MITYYLWLDIYELIILMEFINLPVPTYTKLIIG